MIANGFRALGIVTLGYLLGSAQAAETDHILYGWIFFSIVILILVAIGLPFRQDQLRAASPGATTPPTPAPRAPIVAAASLVVVLTALGPAAAFAFNRAAGAVRRYVRPDHDRPVCGGAERGRRDRTRQGSSCVGIAAPDRICTGLGVMLRARTFAARAAPRPS